MDEQETPEWAKVFEEAVNVRTKALTRQVNTLKTKLKREQEVSEGLRRQLKDLQDVRAAVLEASWWEQ